MVSNYFIEGTLTEQDFILNSIDENPIFADEIEIDITGAVGENLSISLVSQDNSFDPFLEVLDPLTGRLIAFDDNSGRDDNAEIDEEDELEIPENGKLIVRVTNSLDDPDLDDENPYTLNISVPVDDIEVELTPKDRGFADPITDSFVRINGQINTDDFNFSREDSEFTAVTRADEYLLEAPDGEDITIALNSSDTTAFDPFLQVINADTGEVIADSDDDGGGDAERNSLIAPGLGDFDDNGIPAELRIDDDIDYIIRVTSYDSFPVTDLSEAVDYELEVSVPDGEVTVTPRITSDALRLTGGTAQIAYVAYYGRPADDGGLIFWNNVLADNNISYAPREGDRLTGDEQNIYNQIVDQFGNSEEADRLFGDLSDRDTLNQVYQFAFDRDGDDPGLDYWEEQLDLGNVTLATFALEVALGAQNEDITILNNKIASADLFSNSLDTEAERDAYSGSSGERFGRDWLEDFGDTISTQAQVDAALDDLVDSI